MTDLIVKASLRGIKYTIFREPDINNEITAVAFEASNDARKLCSNLPLLVTGKSTLVKKLATHYGTDYVEEYGRAYTEISGTDNLTGLDFENIAIGHQKLINEKLKKGNKVLFVDTEAITTKVFGKMYMGEDFDSFVIGEIIFKQYFDLYFLLDVDVPWIDDGTRDFPENRKEHFNRIKAELDDKGIQYAIISGNYQERFAQAVKEMDKLGYLY